MLRAENALQLSVVDLLYGDLSPFAEETRFGIAFLVTMVGFGAVAALAILAWALDRTVLLWPALALSLVLASGFSLSGHQATEPNSTWATQLADWLHLMAGSIWAGGVLALAVLVWRFAPAAARPGVPRLLAHRSRPGRGPGARRHVPGDRAPAGRLGPVGDARTAGCCC